jgi:hypothetical protein
VSSPCVLVATANTNSDMIFTLEDASSQNVAPPASGLHTAPIVSSSPFPFSSVSSCVVS